MTFGYKIIIINIMHDYHYDYVYELECLLVRVLVIYCVNYVSCNEQTQHTTHLLLFNDNVNEIMHS